MISLADDSDYQSFMMGQLSNDLEIRLLHTGKDLLAQPYLEASNDLTAALHHFVHVYDGTTERLYIDGVERGYVRDGVFPEVPEGVRLLELIGKALYGQTEVTVRPGETVTAGQELARVISTELASLQSALLLARAEVDLARKLRDQRTALDQQGVIAGMLLAARNIGQAWRFAAGLSGDAFIRAMISSISPTAKINPSRI